jgi:Flp pilus assembly protein TadD
VKTLARLAERHPDDWTFTADLARCQIESGDPGAAIVTTTRWLDRHPPTVEVLKLRGAARLLREDWSAAAADLAAATRLRPSDASAWSDLAFAQQQLESPEAADSLRRAVALAPLAGDDRVRLAELLLAAGDVEEARRSVADLESLIPEHPAIDRLHAAISRAGREGGARVRD